MNVDHDPDPVRSDLWNTMDLAELNSELNKLSNKLAALHAMSPNNTPTIRALIFAVQHGYDTVLRMIIERGNTRQPKR